MWLLLMRPRGNRQGDCQPSHETNDEVSPFSLFFHVEPRCFRDSTVQVRFWDENFEDVAENVRRNTQISEYEEMRGSDRCIPIRFREQMPSLIGVMGTTFMAVFISMSIAIFAPFQCDRHPNGYETVRQYPQIICWSAGPENFEEHADGPFGCSCGRGALLLCCDVPEGGDPAPGSHGTGRHCVPPHLCLLVFSVPGLCLLVRSGVVDLEFGCRHGPCYC